MFTKNDALRVIQSYAQEKADDFRPFSTEIINTLNEFDTTTFEIEEIERLCIEYYKDFPYEVIHFQEILNMIFPDE